MFPYIDLCLVQKKHIDLYGKDLTHVGDFKYKAFGSLLFSSLMNLYDSFVPNLYESIVPETIYFLSSKFGRLNIIRRCLVYNFVNWI